MNKEKPFPITCIGAANLDTKAMAREKVRFQSSNPVRSLSSCGGVARNIAEYLGRLGCNTSLITRVGTDVNGEWLIKRSEPFMSFADTHMDSTQWTGCYTAILDHSGDMVLAIADMAVYDTIDCAFIAERWEKIASSQCIVLDTNFPARVLSYIIERCHHEEIPLCVVPGSGAKVEKLPSGLEGISWLILNQEEAQLLVEKGLSTVEDLRMAAQELINKGVERAVITCGKGGIFFKSVFDEEGYLPSPQISVVDVTGAGDAFVSGTLYADRKGKGFLEACQYGMCCSILCLQSDQTVPTNLDEELLLKTFQHYFTKEG